MRRLGLWKKELPKNEIKSGKTSKLCGEAFPIQQRKNCDLRSSATTTGNFVSRLPQPFETAYSTPTDSNGKSIARRRLAKKKQTESLRQNPQDQKALTSR